MYYIGGFSFLERRISLIPLKWYYAAGSDDGGRGQELTNARNVALQARKGKETGSPLAYSEEKHPCGHSDLDPMKHTLDFYIPEH